MPKPTLSVKNLSRHLQYDKTTFHTTTLCQGTLNLKQGTFELHGTQYPLELCALALYRGKWYEKVEVLDHGVEHPYELTNLKWRYLK